MRIEETIVAVQRHVCDLRLLPRREEGATSILLCFASTTASIGGQRPSTGEHRAQGSTCHATDRRTLRTSDRMLLTVEEAADRLRIGRTLMYELIRTGAINTINVGRLRRIEPEALTDLIHNSSTSRTSRASRASRAG